MGIDDVMPGASQPTAFESVSPLMILGIIFFVLPYFNIKFIPGWLGTVGIIFIILGIVHTIYMRW